jgi:glycosyltransferase EpsE
LGDERWALLSQTKVVINLHCGEQTLLEWRRTLDAIHAGAVVVTEHSHGIAPLTPGEHLLVSSPDALPFVAESLLRDPPRLARIREAAYERLRNWIPYALPVSVLRAALVELVGEPISPGASLGSPPAARPVADRQAATTTVEREAAWRPADHEVVAQTPSWEGSSGPAVTIVTAAAGEPSDLVATLRSVTASRFADFELVIAGSDPLALEHARSWMDAHPLVPARLVRAPGPDLAGIRDAALARARGGLCLILDAGQAIYPRALEALTAGLRSAPDAAFAYSIQEVDGRSLASYRRWETWLAHRSDDLRAPALVRADRLRALGGFGTSQNGHRGLDHHLWSRMADRGWRGVLVPEPLARRSTAAQS